MSTTLTDLRERVEKKLADTGNSIWDRDWLDEAIRQALFDYSQVKPRRLITTLAISSDTYELDISSISGLLDVSRVWVPYTASDPEHPPNWRTFEYWQDADILYFPYYQLSSGDTARIFYSALQILSGLDAETSTTFSANDELLLVNGAAGHCAVDRALDLTEKVSVGQMTAQQVRAWGLSKLQEFRTGLNLVARREGLRRSGLAGLGRLDRYDRDWS